MTEKISGDQIQLEENLKRAKERCDKKQNQLLDKEEIYHLSVPDYKDIKADSYIERETRKERGTQDDKYRKLQDEYNIVSTKIAVLENKVKDANRQLEEKLDKTEPIPRSQIIDLEFKKRARFIITDIAKEQENLYFCIEKIRSYEDNLSNLAEYDHFTTIKVFSFEDELYGTGKNNLNELSGKELI